MHNRWTPSLSKNSCLRDDRQEICTEGSDCFVSRRKREPGVLDARAHGLEWWLVEGSQCRRQSSSVLISVSSDSTGVLQELHQNPQWTGKTKEADRATSSDHCTLQNLP